MKEIEAYSTESVNNIEDYTLENKTLFWCKKEEVRRLEKKSTLLRGSYKIAIQCTDELSGKKGSFIYYIEPNSTITDKFEAISKVHKDLISLYSSALYNHYKKLEIIEV